MLNARKRERPSSLKSSSSKSSSSQTDAALSRQMNTLSVRRTREAGQLRDDLYEEKTQPRPRKQVRHYSPPKDPPRRPTMATISSMMRRLSFDPRQRPNTQRPKTQRPKTQRPKTQLPKTQLPKTRLPKTQQEFWTIKSMMERRGITSPSVSTLK